MFPLDDLNPDQGCSLTFFFLQKEPKLQQSAVIPDYGACEGVDG